MTLWRYAVVLIGGNGMNGLTAEGPFDCIHVGAAFLEVPDALVSQLATGGRMLIPIGKAKGEQDLVLIEKVADTNEAR
jgi:protein-L-isoaspartate(D-aspartate) O-methyltransferase